MAKYNKQRKSRSYQGGQYRGGRAKGEKNLTKLPGGGFQNKYGVTFTEAEKKSLVSAVNTANRKRARMLKEMDSLPRMDGKKPTGDTVGTLRIMGKESDFILSPKSKSLQVFRSKAEFENYLDNVRAVNRRDYIDKRTEAYRENYEKALTRAFGSDAKPLIEKMRSMKLKEYREMVAQNDETLEIGYIYVGQQKTEKLNEIREALGMDIQEEFDDDEILSLKRRPSKGQNVEKAKAGLREKARRKM